MVILILNYTVMKVFSPPKKYLFSAVTKEEKVLIIMLLKKISFVMSSIITQDYIALSSTKATAHSLKKLSPQNVGTSWEETDRNLKLELF